MSQKTETGVKSMITEIMPCNRYWKQVKNLVRHYSALDEAGAILEDVQATQNLNISTNNVNQDLSDSDNDSDFEGLE